MVIPNYIFPASACNATRTLADAWNFPTECGFRRVQSRIACDFGRERAMKRPDLSDRLDRRRDDHPVVPRSALNALIQGILP
jgi:hypothetical protein